MADKTPRARAGSLHRPTGTSRPSAHRPSQAVAVAMLVAASACWGLATALSKVALAQLTPLDLFGCEVCVGAVCLGALALSRGARPSRPSLTLLALGALEPGIAFVLFDFGIYHTAATHASLLLSTETLFTVSLAALLLRERLTGRLAVALAAGVAGSVLVAWHAGGEHASLLGDCLVVMASLAAAGYAVLARHIAPEQDPVVVSAVQMLGALLIAAPLTGGSIVVGATHLDSADLGHLALAVTVGLTATVVPFLLFNTAVAHIPAMRAGLILALVPLFGAAASIAVVGETLGAMQAAGGVLVIAAAALAASRFELA
ncbi:MAG TPA: DMT family transporter [Solirubrobacteraceae bacterium]|nr:DMT family transporter [Solirubrobacteraceae bacterium]